MGTLRTIFAISVVFAHSWPSGILFVGGRNAVQLFYIISGFLISYVLVETKSYKTVKSFYLNRYLRLYPIYFAVALITLAAYILTKQAHFLDIYKNAPLDALVFLIFSNIFLFWQDWVWILAVKNDQLQFTSQFLNGDLVLYNGLIVRQAWTLGIELSFYLIAPFVLPRRKLIYILLFMSLALRGYLYHIGIAFEDPWTYRFFPTELAFFLMGTLSHQILLPKFKSMSPVQLKMVSSFATGFLILITMTYFLLPLHELYKSIILFSVFLVLVPLTFIFQNHNPVDNWIGNLSYPIYIGHMLVIWVVTYILKKSGIDNPYYLSIFCVICSIAFAIFLDMYIATPFESLRRRIKQAQT